VSKDGNPISGSEDGPASQPEPAIDSPADVSVPKKIVQDAKTAKDNYEKLRAKIALGSLTEEPNRDTTRPTEWTKRAARPRVEFLSLVNVVGTGEVYLDYAKIPITSTAPAHLEDVTELVTSVEWSRSITPPYESIKVVLRNDHGAWHWMQKGDLANWIYCRVIVPKDSPIDPGRVLIAGICVSHNQTSTASKSGIFQNVTTMSFVGYLDLAARAELFGDFGLRLGSKRGTALAFRELDAIKLKAQEFSEKTGKMGDALNVLWSGAGVTLKRAVVGRGDVGKKEQVLNIDGIARIMWPSALYDAPVGNEARTVTFAGGFGLMSRVISVVHNDRLMKGSHSVGLKGSGYSVPYVPGVCTQLLASHRTGATVMSLIMATFLCDRQMVEAFPATLYRSLGGNDPVIIYRMKPFRITSAGEWIQYSDAMQAFLKKTGAKAASGVVVDTGGRAGDSGTTGKAKYLKHAGRLAKNLQGLQDAYDDIMQNSFGGDVWQLIRARAAVCHREMVFSHSITYTDAAQVNLVSGGIHNSPDTANMYNLYAGVPIMDRDRAYMEGVRSFTSSWPAGIMKQVGAGRYAHNKDQFQSDTMQVRALAFESAQTVLNRGTFGSGSYTTTINPDILPGRAVAVMGFGNVESPVMEVSGFGFDDKGSNPTDSQLRQTTQFKEAPFYSKLAARQKAALDAAGNNQKLDFPIASQPGDAGALTPKVVKDADITAARAAYDRSVSLAKHGTDINRLRRAYLQAWKKKHADPSSGEKFEYGTSFAYVEKATHTMETSPSGHVTLRTQMEYSRYCDDESERMLVKTIGSIPANALKRIKDLEDKQKTKTKP